ncbi:hypothetical protein [Streptomyces griseofuscus]|uniref:hypothetical protein n=1 Tax=Streptomyces griseofuscus TaxID=146922 RepID=UPI003819ADF2
MESGTSDLCRYRDEALVEQLRGGGIEHDLENAGLAAWIRDPADLGPVPASLLH